MKRSLPVMWAEFAGGVSGVLLVFLCVMVGKATLDSGAFFGALAGLLVTFLLGMSGEQNLLTSNALRWLYFKNIGRGTMIAMAAFVPYALIFIPIGILAGYSPALLVLPGIILAVIVQGYVAFTGKVHVFR